MEKKLAHSAIKVKANPCPALYMEHRYKFRLPDLVRFSLRDRQYVKILLKKCRSTNILREFLNMVFNKSNKDQVLVRAKISRRT
jgi:hypothetical protein